MYTLFYSPGSASMAPHAMLEEPGAKYALRRIDISAEMPRDPEYLKLNPLGRVPTLVIEGGETIYESAAITMYLADRHPDAKLAPAITDPLRGPYYQWLAHLTNTLQEGYLLFFYPDRNTTRPEQAPGSLAPKFANLKRCMDLVAERPAVKRLLQQNGMA